MVRSYPMPEVVFIEDGAMMISVNGIIPGGIQSVTVCQSVEDGDLVRVTAKLRFYVNKKDFKTGEA